MKNTKGRALLRAQLNAPVLYRMVNFLFAMMVLAGLILALFFNTNNTYNLSWNWLVPAVFFSFGILFLITRAMMLAKPIGHIKERVFAILLFVCLAAFLFVTAFLLQTDSEGTWAFGEIFRMASAYVNEGTLPGNYLSLHPQHNMLYVFMCGYFSLFRLFGLTNFIIPCLVLNCVLIFTSVLCTYFAARKLFGANQSLLMLLWGCLFSPFLLMQAPLLQGGTLALVFVAASVLLWVNIRKVWRAAAFRKAFFLFCVLSALLALGSLFQPMVLSLYVAVVLDLIFLLCGRGKIWLIAAGTAVLVLVVVGSQMAVNNTFLAHYSMDDKMPRSAGWMMGLSSLGTESLADTQMLEEAQTYTARQTLIFDEAQMRLDQMGIMGVVQHFGTKMSIMFSDGSLGATDLLDAYTVQRTGALQMLVLPSGVLYYIYAYGAFALWGSLAIWVVIASVRSLLNQNEALTVLRVALLFSVLFGLFWVVSPQHFIPVLPLFLLCAMEMYPRPSYNTKQELLNDDELGMAMEEEHASQYVDYMDPSFRWTEDASHVPK